MILGYADRLSVRPEETIRFHAAIINNQRKASQAAEASSSTSPTATSNSTARIVRVICADPHKTEACGGIQTTPLHDSHIECLQEPATSLCGTRTTRQRGSHAEIPIPIHVYNQLQKDCFFDDNKGLTLAVTIMPTSLLRTEDHRNTQTQTQTIMSLDGLFHLYLDSTTGRVCFHVWPRNKGETSITCEGEESSSSSTTTNLLISTTPLPLSVHHWYTVYASLDTAAESNQIQVGWTRHDDTKETCVEKLDISSSDWKEISSAHHHHHHQSTADAALILAATRRISQSNKDDDDDDDATKLFKFTSHFNGRIEHPRIWNQTISSKVILAQSSSEQNDDSGILIPPPFGEWDFSQDITTQTITDVSSSNHQQLHGFLVNGPTRAVRGSTWSGREMCWKYAAPSEYAAIHFHDDDFTDCDWPVCYQWTVPKDFKSGNYALILEQGVDEEGGAHHEKCQENIPFFVVPPKGQKQADLAVVVSTFTYIIYANHARGEWLDGDWRAAWKEQVTKHDGAYPYNPREHPEYGWSTYNLHSDGSGISLASWKRPMFNLRLGYITFPYQQLSASGLRHYPADSHLTAWLENQDVEYDIITDWELHTEGVDVLKPYRVVMTGSHPEYHSTASLNALHDYKAFGGRLMYMGGNGFYWKIVVDEENCLLEIRRGEGGIRAWASEPGEYYHQLQDDLGGQYGGLWRRNGRAPQQLVGVGFTAQDHFQNGRPYKIHGHARSNRRTAWMFNGISSDTDTIGNHGLSAHGAAGFELDRADVSLGTPEHAVIVASSENHGPDAILVFEDKLTHHGNLLGVPDKDLIRADMVFFETPSDGGAVFSTGSITYCGSLLTNGCDNDISKLTKNVLDRFLDTGVSFAVPKSC